MEQFGDVEMMFVEEVVGSLKAHEERLRGATESREAPSHRGGIVKEGNLRGATTTYL